MMASLSGSSLPIPPSSSHARKPSEPSHSNGGLKPITVTGNPPTFVSAPGRRIVAGEVFNSLICTVYFGV